MANTALQLIMAPDQTQRLEALLQRVIAVEVGTLLTFDELYAVTGLHQKPPLYWLIIRANRELLPGRTMLVNMRGQGYRKATAHQQMGHADKRRLFGTRQLRKSVDELIHTDEKQLSESERVSLGHEIQLAHMRLDTARRKTLQAKVHNQKAVIASDAALEDLAEIKAALHHVWKKIR